MNHAQQEEDNKDSKTVRFEKSKCDTEEENEECHSVVREVKEEEENIKATQPETMIAILCERDESKLKMVRVSCGMRATDSWIN